jgi:hypothetical protein
LLSVAQGRDLAGHVAARRTAIFSKRSRGDANAPDRRRSR